MLRSDVDQTVAARFTRTMNAATSPLGKLSDLVLASALSGMLLVSGLFVIRHATSIWPAYLVVLVALCPMAASWLVGAKLAGSRDEVIAWLGQLPFEVVNLNALLAGVSDRFEVVFGPTAVLPSRAALAPLLEQVHDDVLLLETFADRRAIQIALGVIDIKRLPLWRQHERWRRFVQVVDGVLVPLSGEAPIEAVHIV